MKIVRPLLILKKCAGDKVEENRKIKFSIINNIDNFNSDLSVL